MSVIKGMKWSK